MTLTEKFSIGLSAAIGGVIAALAEMTQKGATASAIIKISDTLESILLMKVSPIFTVLLIVALGVAVCFIFESDTKQRAFFVGASILSIIMTFTPIKPVNLDQVSVTHGIDMQSPSLMWFTPRFAYAAEAGVTTENVMAQLQLKLLPDDGDALSDVVVTVKDSQTRKVIGRSIVSGEQHDFYLRAGDYIITVEVPGYLREYRRVSVRNSEPSVIEFPLKTTIIPLPFQRLF